MSSVAVFIHLGKSPAKHLWLNLGRHMRLFPDIETYLIIDEERHIRNIPKDVRIIQFERKNQFLQQKNLGGHDHKFRRGFWRFSLERLFALAEFHEIIPNKGILHIESDVLLMPNFPWHEIDSVNRPLWNNYNEERDVAALLYYPNFKIHSEVITIIEDLLTKNPLHTDMTVLAEIRKMSTVPNSFFPSIASEVPDLRNLSNKVGSIFLDKIADSSFFELGVFDGAPIGMWLLGHDPRNNYGASIVHDLSPIVSGDSIIDPSCVDYEIDNHGNLNIVSRLTQKKTKLWCLHVHTKSLKLFSPTWERELREYVELARNPSEIFRFSKLTLWLMLIESIKSRTFLRFIIGLPIVHRFRRWLSPLKRSILSKYSPRDSREQ